MTSGPLPAGPGPCCPLCGEPGSEIPREVLFQHLDSSGITQTFFWKNTAVCLRHDCECLYYSGPKWVSHRHCNKKAGFKDVPPPHVLCYCFGYTGEEILKSAGTQAPSPILREIETYLEKGGHLCGKTNPSGRDCRGVIRDFLRRQGLEGPGAR